MTVQRSLWLSGASEPPDGSSSVHNHERESAGHTGAPCPICGEVVTPQPQRRGHAKEYCSPRCQAKGWARAHPRVDEAIRKPDKLTRCQMILGRLQVGRATGGDLVKAGGGLRYGGRISELRARGHRILGPKPWRRPDGTRETKTISPDEQGHDLYELRW